ncbi:hypothetical protein J3E72DRAFT_302849, partial [Bipolaris maydis]
MCHVYTYTDVPIDGGPKKMNRSACWRWYSVLCMAFFVYFQRAVLCRRLAFVSVFFIVVVSWLGDSSGIVEVY